MNQSTFTKLGHLIFSFELIIEVRPLTYLNYISYPILLMTVNRHKSADNVSLH